VLSVNELIFRGKDRVRPSWRVLSIVGLALTVSVIIGHLGVVGLCLLAGLTAAVIGLGIGAALRSWTRVGPAGITICWGIGRRGRTFPWQEIRWIDVWKGRGAHSGGAAQMTLANGRRLRLPALASTSAYPQPTFPEDFRRVVAWWEFSTDPAARFQPRLTLRTRLAPYLIGVTITLLVLAGFVIVRGIQT
jgi:hypothetical protein